MSPGPQKAKKKRKRKKRPVPPAPVVVAPAPVPVPAPILHPRQKRFWKVIRTQNLIGGAMILAGFSFLMGYLLTDKAHLHEKVALYVGLALVLFGAHFLSSEPTERALMAFGRTAAKVIPGARKNGGTNEHVTAKPGD